MDGRFTMIPDELSARTDLSCSAKLLYCHIRRHEQGNVGVCIASNKRLAHDIGESPSTVERGLSSLEAAGLITRITHGKTRTITTKDWTI